jgi:hypothetical protein
MDQSSISASEVTNLFLITFRIVIKSIMAIFKTNEMQQLSPLTMQYIHCWLFHKLISVFKYETKKPQLVFRLN